MKLPWNMDCFCPNINMNRLFVTMTDHSSSTKLAGSKLISGSNFETFNIQKLKLGRNFNLALIPKLTLNTDKFAPFSALWNHHSGKNFAF